MSSIDAATFTLQFKEMQLFHDFEIERNSHYVEVPWDKVRLLLIPVLILELLNGYEAASILYCRILFKYLHYNDAYLRLAAIAKDQENIILSIELVGDALKVKDKR